MTAFHPKEPRFVERLPEWNSYCPCPPYVVYLAAPRALYETFDEARYVHRVDVVPDLLSFVAEYFVFP
jgi:hypothetical protein